MIKNIIFSGGGLKAWAYIGTIQALEIIPRNTIEEVIGVSAGSIFGLFYVLNIKWNILLDYFINLDLKEMLDININNIIINQSLFEGKIFKKTIQNLLQLNKINPELTFIELYRLTGITFTTNATNINENVLEYFNHKRTPYVKVIDAIVASSTLPILFPPYRINQYFYYDGGFCNNCPVETVDELFTIAFDLTTSKKEKTNDSFKLFDLLMCLTVMNNKKESTFENIYSILDNKFKDEFMNLSQSKDDIFNIYMNGYHNSRDILFKNHIALKL
jgi:predicted acylesterase/phospholipase RssA